MTIAGDRSEYIRNKEKYAQYSKEYQKAHKKELSLYARSYHRKKKYGLSEEACIELLNKQGNKCAICEVPLTIHDRFTIDHDHDCCDSVQTCGNCVCGILCMNCNAGLGNFRDCLELLKKAVKYLKRTRE